MFFIWTWYRTVTLLDLISSKNLNARSIQTSSALGSKRSVRKIISKMFTFTLKYNWSPDPTKWACIAFTKIVASKKLCFASTDREWYSLQFVKCWISRCCEYNYDRHGTLKYFVILAGLRFCPIFCSRPIIDKNNTKLMWRHQIMDIATRSSIRTQVGERNWVSRFFDDISSTTVLQQQKMNVRSLWQ